jgi:hypothetical protein
MTVKKVSNFTPKQSAFFNIRRVLEEKLHSVIDNNRKKLGKVGRLKGKKPVKSIFNWFPKI